MAETKERIWEELIIENESYDEIMDYMKQITTLFDLTSDVDQMMVLLNGEKVPNTKGKITIFLEKESWTYYSLGYNERTKKICLTPTVGYDRTDVLAKVADKYGAFYVNDAYGPNEMTWLWPTSVRTPEDKFNVRVIDGIETYNYGQYRDGRFFKAEHGRIEYYNADYVKLCTPIKDPKEKLDWLSKHRIERDGRSNLEIIRSKRGAD